MNEINNDVIKHCQALANLTRHYNDEIISFTIMRGKIEILLFGTPSNELASKCRNIKSEEMEEDTDTILTVRYTAEYADDIEIHWYEYKPLEDRILSYCSKCGRSENANCMYVNGQDRVLCSGCMVAEERDWYERITKPADRKAMSDEELLESCGYPTVAELREKGVIV